MENKKTNINISNITKDIEINNDIEFETDIECVKLRSDAELINMLIKEKEKEKEKDINIIEQNETILLNDNSFPHNTSRYKTLTLQYPQTIKSPRQHVYPKTPSSPQGKTQLIKHSFPVLPPLITLSKQSSITRPKSPI